MQGLGISVCCDGSVGLGKASLKWHLSVLSGYQLPCLDGQDAGVADAEWDVEVGR